MTKEAFGTAFLKIALHRVCDLYFLKLKEAFKPVTKEILWREAYENGNSIGGIVLHVCEHVHRSCIRLTEQDQLLKQGFENYFPNQNDTPEEVLHRLEEQLNDWKALMKQYIHNEKEFNLEHLHHLFHMVEHAGYHLGQVIDRIQGSTGVKFEFCKNGLNENYLREKIEADDGDGLGY